MTWTFDEALGTDRDKVRDLIGDTDDADQQLSDESIVLALSVAGGNIVLAAARSARKLMARYARRVTTSVGSYSEQMSDLYTHYKDLAETLEMQSTAVSAPSFGYVAAALATEETDGPIFTRHLHEAESDATRPVS